MADLEDLVYEVTRIRGIEPAHVKDLDDVVTALQSIQSTLEQIRDDIQSSNREVVETIRYLNRGDH